VLKELQSDVFETLVVALAIVATIGTVGSAVMLWRQTRAPSKSAGQLRNARHHGVV